MTRRHIWVIEWTIHKHWEPRHVFEPGAKKKDVQDWLKEQKLLFPDIPYRLQKYIPEKSK